METPDPPPGKVFRDERYHFADIVVDAAGHTLTRGGQPVSVEPKVFTVLLTLLRQPGTLVPRDELLDVVWGHRHVTPGVLTRAIAQLRAALGDDAQHPRFIQTRHALGYRFIGTLEPGSTPEAPPSAEPAGLPGARGAVPVEADVPTPPAVPATASPGLLMADSDRGEPRRWSPHGTTPSTSGPDPPVGTQRWEAGPEAGIDGMPEPRWRWFTVIAIAGLLGVLGWLWLGRGGPPGPRADASVAVLPFTSLGSTQEDRYFAEGLAVEMHDALAGIPGVKVAAHLGPDARGRAESDPVALGRALGVATVLDATVRREGERIRISARLTDVGTGYTLWAHSYEREAAGVFEVQSEIAGKVVESLVGVLPTSRPQLSRRLKPTVSTAAYDAYLKGVQQLLVPRSEQALGRAVAFFKQALKEDAGFARAQAGICRVEIRRFESSRDAPALNRARTACDRAAHMDPNLLLVSLAMGDLDRVRGDYPQAIEHYTRALQDQALRPDAYIGLAATQAALGNNPVALDYYERAHQLRPGDANLHSELGYHHYLNGDLEKAIASYRIATTLQPDSAKLWSSLGGVYHVAGRRTQAADAYSRSLALEPTYGALSNFASLRFEDRAYTEAAELYRRAAQLEPDDYRLWGNIGDALAADPSTAAQARSPYARAATMAEAYMKLKGDDAMAPAQLAWYRANLDQVDGVRELLARADAMGTETAEVEFIAAQTLARMGDRGGAIERVRQALRAGVPLERIRTSPLLRGMDAEAASGSPAPAASSPPPKA
ncbi:tetratricopeptide repeat protein [Aerolutibacter ruishenii]|uniref:TolB-like protein n=1 Tax=Aerolutibacter ruishenii TaxID=686800 RepID=A0A562LSQ3_9GAMM|nr:tetratricopeptide repeat protein [Lysobacter ruishenii]TWI10593.1 TolB-like protein [Lysobacter ruishenii]